jgi:hypothetical protein
MADRDIAKLLHELRTGRLNRRQVVEVDMSAFDSETRNIADWRRKA